MPTPKKKIQNISECAAFPQAINLFCKRQEKSLQRLLYTCTSCLQLNLEMLWKTHFFQIQVTQFQPCSKWCAYSRSIVKIEHGTSPVASSQQKYKCTKCTWKIIIINSSSPTSQLAADCVNYFLKQSFSSTK